MQLGKTGFIQLHLPPELGLTALHLMAVGQNCSIQRVQLFIWLICYGSVNYLTMYGLVVFMFCLQ